ncbi:MAG: type II toxin-antitoxin system VapC family toxin [Verrucomicrobiota bacterium]
MPAIGEVLLDTTVVVAHLRGSAGVSQHLANASVRYLSAVALGELHYGIRCSARSEENLRQLERWLQVVEVLPVSAGAAEQYGRLKDVLALAGTPIPENDLWMAAVAMEHGLPLATRDEHFLRVPGLSVLDWR